MAWGWINYKKIREFYFGVNYIFKLAQWFIIYLTTSHCIHVLGEIKPWEWIIWCLHYLFSSFRILRNFSALVSTVLVLSCSLAASSSFNFSAFFKAVHWQGKVGGFFPRLSKCACMHAAKGRCMTFKLHHTWNNFVQVPFPDNVFSIMLLSNDIMWDILHVAMMVRYSYQLCQEQNTNQRWCVLFSTWGIFVNPVQWGLKVPSVRFHRSKINT